MRQVVITRHGPPEVLRLEEVPDPEPGPGDVRIRVTASGVNFADVLARIGFYPDAPPPPVVVGYEVAGVVDAVGAGVTTPVPGDRVLAMVRFKGHADAVIARAAFVFPIPAVLTDVEAAAIPVTYLTAAIALYRMANLARGDWVLVHGVGGGVGMAATQLAQARGARVIGTASAGKHAALRELGVEHLVSYTDDLTAAVERVTNRHGVDVVLDPVGGRSFETSYRLLAPLGRLVMFGASAIATGERRNWLHAARLMWQMPRFHPLSLINRNRGVFGLNLGHLWDQAERLREAMVDVLAGVEAGRLRPIIAKTFPLEQTADAHRYLQSRSNIGKVVLTTGG